MPPAILWLSGTGPGVSMCHVDVSAAFLHPCTESMSAHVNVPVPVLMHFENSRSDSEFVKCSACRSTSSETEQ